MEHLELNGELKATAPHTMEFMSSYIYHLTEEMMERAEKELGETSETREQALIEMKHIIKKINLNCPTDDDYLLQYLRVRKFNVKRSIDTLRNYYNYMKDYPALFGKTNFEAVRKACEKEMCILLPYRDVDGANIMVLQARHWNVRALNFSELIHAIGVFMAGCVDSSPATQICGIKPILDAKGLTTNHLVHMSPRTLFLVARGISNCFPVRFPAIHVVNQSPVILYLWKLFKIALSEKLKKRVHFHSSSFESLHSKINPALLPESLGGTLVYDNTLWMKFVEDREFRYFELMSYGVDSETCPRM